MRATTPRWSTAFHPVLPAFHVRIAQRGRLRVVEVEGEIDLLTAPTLAAALRDDEGFDAVVLDLGKVPFISLIGLRVITSVHRRLSRRGGGVAVANLRRHVAWAFEFARPHEPVVVAADVEDAVARLGAA